jgi:hypothetical protein
VFPSAALSKGGLPEMAARQGANTDRIGRGVTSITRMDDEPLTPFGTSLSKCPQSQVNGWVALTFGGARANAEA